MKRRLLSRLKLPIASERQDTSHIAELAYNIKYFGQIVPIFIDKDNNVISGIKRVLALRFLKRRTCIVSVVDPTKINMVKFNEVILRPIGCR